MAQLERKKVTILADYSFCMTSKVDNLYQFVDCRDVDLKALAVDIRAGVIDIKHSRVVVALGNTAVLDRYTNVATGVTAVTHALIERYGAVNIQVIMMGILPRLRLDTVQLDILKKQNNALSKTVCNMIRHRKLPVEYLPAYKWAVKEGTGG